MYSVYDSQKQLVKKGFTDWKSAYTFKCTFGNAGWYIK